MKQHDTTRPDVKSVTASCVHLLHKKSNMSGSCVCVTSANESADLPSLLCRASDLWLIERGRKEGSRRGGLMQGSLAPTLLAVSLPSPPPVTHTPSVSAGLYPQPPAACLEQQQRETVGSQSSWQGGREGGRRDSGREKRGGERRGGGKTLDILWCFMVSRDS